LEQLPQDYDLDGTINAGDFNSSPAEIVRTYPGYVTAFDGDTPTMAGNQNCNDNFVSYPLLSLKLQMHLRIPRCASMTPDCILRMPQYAVAYMSVPKGNNLFHPWFLKDLLIFHTIQ
jgi:hypothetical protein